MEDEKSRRLQQIIELAENGHDREVVDEINALYQEYPDDVEIGFVWLKVAEKNHGYHQVLVVGTRLLRQSKGLSRKAEISALMSTAAFYESDYENAAVYQLKAFFFLCMMADSDAFITQQKKDAKTTFSTEDANKYLAELLTDLKKAGLRCAPIYGTLLGLQRNGKIIPHDKDIDIICDSSIFEEVKLYFYKSGHVLAHADIFENFISFKHPHHAICVDVSSAHTTPKKTLLGFTPKGFATTTWKYEDVVESIRFTESTLSGNPIFSIENPTEFLKAVYGDDWEIPMPNYIPFLDSKASVDSGLRRYYANLQILRRWLNGDIENALRGSKLLSDIDPYDATNLYVQSSLIKTVDYFNSLDSADA